MHAIRVTASAGQRRGDVEIRDYLQDTAGRRILNLSLVFNLKITHDCFGISHPHDNGKVTHPRDFDATVEAEETYCRAKRDSPKTSHEVATSTRLARCWAAQNPRVPTTVYLQSEYLASPRDGSYVTAHARRICASSLSRSQLGDRGALPCHWTPSQHNWDSGQVPFSPHGMY